MNFKSILTIVVLSIFVTVAGGLAIWQWRVSEQNAALAKEKATELQTANLEIGRAHTQIESDAKVHAQAIGDLSKQLQDEIKKHKAVVDMYAQLEAKYNSAQSTIKGQAQTIEELIKASSIADLPAGKLLYKKEDGTLSEVKSIKWTINDFRLDLEGESTPTGFNEDKTIKITHSWSYKMHLKFRARLIETTMPDKTVNHYAELYEIGPDGKDINKLVLDKFEVVKGETLPKRMFWWNPHLDLGVGIGGSLKPNATGIAEVGISLMGHGVTKDDLNWRFVRFGLGASTNKGFTMTISPVQYNIGKNIPLCSNLWLAPYAGYDFALMAFHFGLGISVVF